MTVSDHGEIVMAVYRPDPRLLRTQVASLRGQTLTTWTCRIGIDGADPATAALLRELVAEDERFAVIEYDDNVGVYRHFERMLADVAADAAWVALSDQDDRWHPTKLEQLVPELGPEVTAVSCQALVVDQDYKPLGRTDRRSGGVVDLLLRNQVTGSLAVWRRDVLDVALPFPPATDIAIHDHWLAVCAAAMGEVRVVDRPLQDYVQHGGNVLGEVVPTGLGDKVREVRARGGARSFLDYNAEERWGWRVGMAEALRRRFEGRAMPPAVAAIAERRAAPAVLRALVSGVRSRHLSARGAAGMGVAALWAGRSRTGRIGS